MIIQSAPDAHQMRDHWWLRPGWAPDTRMLAWHLTFEGEAGLHRLVQDAQRALDSFDVLDPVPPEWLHLSLATFGATTEVTDDCVRQAINAAHEHLSALNSLELDVFPLPARRQSIVETAAPSAHAISAHALDPTPARTLARPDTPTPARSREAPRRSRGRRETAGAATCRASSRRSRNTAKNSAPCLMPLDFRTRACSRSVHGAIIDSTRKDLA